MPVFSPAGSVDCDPVVNTATKNEFELRNPKKAENYIYGIVDNGVLDFIVYNLPTSQPPTGCPGRWLFEQMWAHFQAVGTIISAIGGNWSGNSTNLQKVNMATTNNAMTLEEAAKITNTALYAKDVGYSNLNIIYPIQPGGFGTKGTPGNYTAVNVRFSQ